MIHYHIVSTNNIATEVKCDIDQTYPTSANFGHCGQNGHVGLC